MSSYLYHTIILLQAFPSPQHASMRTASIGSVLPHYRCPRTYIIVLYYTIASISIASTWKHAHWAYQLCSTANTTADLWYESLALAYSAETAIAVVISSIIDRSLVHRKPCSVNCTTAVCTRVAKTLILLLKRQHQHKKEAWRVTRQKKKAWPRGARLSIGYSSQIWPTRYCTGHLQLFAKEEKYLSVIVWGQGSCGTVLRINHSCTSVL